MDYFEALKQISQPIRASDLPQSLEHVKRLLEGLDHPEQVYPSIVVAGSVGKGTTCHQIAALMNDHYKVGLYTSPHLHIFRERFVINGQMISQPEFVVGLQSIQQAAKNLNTHYSTFELSTALALWWFREQGIDIAILEIGIGGRYDAVNAANNSLAVITPIEREHAAMLGGTIESIASHKAGIIQPDSYVISAPQVSEVEAVLRQEAAIQQAAITFEPLSTLAVTACANLMQRDVISTFDLPLLSPTVHLPGRMEQIEVQGKTLLIDGAHTPGSARRLRAAIEQLDHQSPIHLIIGMLRDKAVHNFLAEFDDVRFHITLTQTTSHRALTAEEIQHTSALQRSQISTQPDLQTALNEALESSETLIVITGSLRMAALSREFLGLLKTDEILEAQTTRSIFEGKDYLAKLG